VEDKLSLIVLDVERVVWRRGDGIFFMYSFKSFNAVLELRVVGW
jgi:hypothetical protein